MQAMDHSSFERFNVQAQRVWHATVPRNWFTLEEISRVTGDPIQSVSARLRDFRKEAFGSHTVERRQVSRGLFEYLVVPNVAQELRIL